MKLARTILVFYLLIIALPARADRADELINRLTDPDASVRQQAETSLTAMGEAARPTLIAACRSDTPAIAAAASRVLLAQTWWKKEDPTMAKQLLADYGASDEPGRISIASQLNDMGRPGTPILLRLIVEDPSEDVCWKIVSMLQLQRRRDARTLDLIRRLNPPDSRPAAMVLVARAWEHKDRDKAIALLNRAVQAESRRRSYDDGELDYAFDLLSKVAVGRGNYNEAARLRRLQAARIGLTRDFYPTPVFELFVLHGKYGPLDGLDQDTRVCQQYLGHPQVLYALSRAYERAGRAIEAQAYADAALVSAFEPAERRSASERTLVISFLKMAGWTDLARREAYTVLNNDSPDTRSDRQNARLQLAELAMSEDDHAQAIEHFAALRELLDTPQTDSPSGQRYVDSQIAWRKARLAEERGDLVEANRHIDSLIALAPLDHQVLLDAYPIVLSLGRSDEAAKLFEPVYTESREQLDADPENPIWMNELAWTCARCDQKLDEALKLAEKAVALEPDNAAFIDTLAEVLFRLGRADEAVKLEIRALELEPGDAFMTKQLERFKGMTKAKAE